MICCSIRDSHETKKEAVKCTSLNTITPTFDWNFDFQNKKTENITSMTINKTRLCLFLFSSGSSKSCKGVLNELPLANFSEFLPFVPLKVRLRKKIFINWRNNNWKAYLVCLVTLTLCVLNELTVAKCLEFLTKSFFKSFHGKRS